MEINDILLEWSYRLKKGYPTMKDGKFTEPSELKVLHEILKENGINEMPSFVRVRLQYRMLLLKLKRKKNHQYRRECQRICYSKLLTS